MKFMYCADVNVTRGDENTSDPPVAIIAGAAGGGVSLIILIALIVVFLKLRYCSFVIDLYTFNNSDVHYV